MKKVNLLFGLGIVLAPYIFSPFTLLPGYSRKAKMVSHIYLISFMLLMSMGSAQELLPMYIITTLILYLIVGLCWIPKLCSNKIKNDIQQQYDEEYEEAIKELKSGTIKVINTNMILKNGEEALLQCYCSLKETRAVRHSFGNGSSVRVFKGFSVHSGKSTSYSTDEYTTIDRGSIVLTTNRIIFDGEKSDRVIPLKDIISINPFLNGIEVSTSRYKKSMIFVLPNAARWYLYSYVMAREVLRDAA